MEEDREEGEEEAGRRRRPRPHPFAGAVTESVKQLGGCLAPIIGTLAIPIIMVMLLLCVFSGGLGALLNPGAAVQQKLHDLPGIGQLVPTPAPKGLFGTGIGPDFNPQLPFAPTATPTPIPDTRNAWERIIGAPTNTPMPTPTSTPTAPRPAMTPTASPTPLPQRLGEINFSQSPKLAIEIASCTFPFTCGGTGSLTVKSLEVYEGKVALVADVQFKGIGNNYLWTEGGTMGPTVLKVNDVHLPAVGGQMNINLPANGSWRVIIWFAGSLDSRILGSATQVSLQAPWLKDGQGKIK